MAELLQQPKLGGLGDVNSQQEEFIYLMGQSSNESLQCMESVPRLKVRRQHDTLEEAFSKQRNSQSNRDSLSKLLSSLWKLKYGRQAMPETATYLYSLILPQEKNSGFLLANGLKLKTKKNISLLFLQLEMANETQAKINGWEFQECQLRGGQIAGMGFSCLSSPLPSY